MTKLGKIFWESSTNKVVGISGIITIIVNLIFSTIVYGFNGQQLLLSLAWSLIVFILMFLNTMPIFGIAFLIFGFPIATSIIGPAMGLTSVWGHFTILLGGELITTLYWIKDTVLFMEIMEIEKLRCTIWQKKS